VGRPIGNTQIYILDRRRNPVPVGITGDLFIGGHGVARGYLNRPELNGERFLPDPFCGRPDARMYNTGDLARYLPDGTIDFIGRSDFQVKVRGHRIELGEIEAVLAQHPSVLQAVVTILQDPTRQAYLAAYATSKEPLPPVSELRAFMKNRLPDYMVPATYLRLDAFPLTPNGKVDRQALPDPQGTEHPADKPTAFEPPATPVEETLAAIWRSVLNLDEISVHDNFFDLGGHSILAIRIFSEIESQLGQALPLGALYEAPTIRMIAVLLEDRERIWTPLVTIQDQGTKPPFFCVGGGVLHMRNLSRRLGSDQPYYALQTETLEGERLLRADLEAIAEDMLAEVRRVQPRGPYYLGGAYGSAMVALEMARRLVRNREEVAILVAFNTVPQLKANSTVHRIARRLSKMLRTSPAHWAEQLQEVSWLHARESFMSIYWQVAFRFYRAIGRPMPLRLRAGHYAEMLLRRAANSYRPDCNYVGDVTLFLTPEWYEKCQNHVNWGWNAHIRGRASADKVPGDPCTMFTEPNVSILAQHLRTRLHEARTRVVAASGEASPAAVPLRQASVGSTV
jgi:thioesterase domain-containing protein/acyl carrier protein